MKKVLVIRYGGVGDLITTLPVLKSLKESGYSVMLASNSRYRGLCEKYTGIEGFIPVDDTFLLPLFSEEGNTYIADFLNQFNIIISYTEAEEIFSLALKKHFRGDIIFHSVRQENIKQHIVKHMLISICGIADTICEVPELLIKKSEPKEFFVIHPGSGSVHKNWKREYFLHLYKQLSTMIRGVVILGYAEKDQQDFWYKNIPLSDIAELENIEQVVHYAEKTSFYFGNDSGISHLFSAAGVPSVVIFGPTSPYIWSPVGENVKILYKSHACSPCGQEKRQLCREKTCLDLITVNDVLKTGELLWKRI